MKKRIPILPIIISLLLLVLTAAFAAAVLRAGLLPTAWTVLLFASGAGVLGTVYSSRKRRAE